MAYGYEFPHSSMFDSDLREVIELCKKILGLHYSSDIKVYLNVDEMIKDHTLEKGNRVCTLGYFDYNDGGGCEYIIRESAPNVPYISLLNAKYAEPIFTLNSEINLKKFGVKDYDDITPILDTLINLGCNNFKIPAGHYLLQLIVKKKIRLCGDPQYRTYIHPVENNSYMLTFKANGNALEYLNIEHLTFNAYDKRANGIYVEGKSVSDYFDRSTFNDIDIINCNIGFRINSRMIWNSFTDLRISYCIVALQQQALNTDLSFNLNAFYNCVFSNNSQSGVDFRNAGVNNVFYSCNFERNCLVATTGIYGDLRSTGGSIECYGCYFEKEYSSQNTHLALEITDCVLTVNGCSFTHYNTLARLIGGTANLVGNACRFVNTIFHNNTTANIFTSANQFTTEQISAIAKKGRKIMESEYYS